jgi:hypothetical protein
MKSRISQTMPGSENPCQSQRGYMPYPARKSE